MKVHAPYLPGRLPARPALPVPSARCAGLRRAPQEARSEVRAEAGPRFGPRFGRRPGRGRAEVRVEARSASSPPRRVRRVESAASSPPRRVRPSSSHAINSCCARSPTGPGRPRWVPREHGLNQAAGGVGRPARARSPRRGPAPVVVGAHGLIVWCATKHGSASITRRQTLSLIQPRVIV